MPASFTIDHERRLVLSRAWGVVEDGDLQANQREVAADPRFEPGYSQLYDFSEVTEVRATNEGVRGLVRTSVFARDSRRAIVAPSDIVFGMVRMYELTGDLDPRVFRVFRNIGEAMAWLEESGR